MKLWERTSDRELKTFRLDRRFILQFPTRKDWVENKVLGSNEIVIYSEESIDRILMEIQRREIDSRYLSDLHS